MMTDRLDAAMEAAISEKRIVGGVLLVCERGETVSARAIGLSDRASGRVMEVYTSLPGIQFYSGNFLDGSPGSGGYEQYSGMCLETQYFPNSPNEPRFQSVILQPGDEFKAKTVHKFYSE